MVLRITAELVEKVVSAMGEPVSALEKSELARYPWLEVEGARTKRGWMIVLVADGDEKGFLPQLWMMHYSQKRWWQNHSPNLEVGQPVVYEGSLPLEILLRYREEKGFLERFLAWALFLEGADTLRVNFASTERGLVLSTPFGDFTNTKEAWILQRTWLMEVLAPSRAA